VIRVKHNKGCVWRSIPALGNKRPAQSSEFLEQYPGEPLPRVGRYVAIMPLEDE